MESKTKEYFIDYFDNAVAKNKIFHSYIVEVDNYEEDFDLVLSIVQMIVENKEYNQLEKNDIYNQIKNNNYIDLKIIEPEGNVIKKSQLLELQKEFSNTSLLNGKKIYIIKYADKFSDSSANTMLKFLEEPNDNVVAFLLSSNKYKMLPTILSRCLPFTIKDVFDKMKIDEKSLQLLEIILNKSFFNYYNHICENIVSDKDDTYIKFSNASFYILAYYNYLCNENLIVSERIIHLLEKYPLVYMFDIYTVLEDCLLELKYNLNYKMWIDYTFKKILEGEYNEVFNNN